MISARCTHAGLAVLRNNCAGRVPQLTALPTRWRHFGGHDVCPQGVRPLPPRRATRDDRHQYGIYERCMPRMFLAVTSLHFISFVSDSRKKYPNENQQNKRALRRRFAVFNISKRGQRKQQPSPSVDFCSLLRRQRKRTQIQNEKKKRVSKTFHLMPGTQRSEALCK